MTGSRKLLALALVAFTILVPSIVGAASGKPWYASRFEKLGFYVFDTPSRQADFTVETMAGKLATRSSLKGNIVLLNFWATWCPPCKEEIPSIENLAVAMQGKNFKVMAVSVGETRSTVASFVAERKMTYPVYLDPRRSLTATYASRGIPTTYVIDKNGDFIAAVIGGIKYDSAETISLFAELASR